MLTRDWVGLSTEDATANHCSELQVGTDEKGRLKCILSRYYNATYILKLEFHTVSSDSDLVNQSIMTNEIEQLSLSVTYIII